jgi:hypothetical protein
MGYLKQLDKLLPVARKFVLPFPCASTSSAGGKGNAPRGNAEVPRGGASYFLNPMTSPNAAIEEAGK